MEAADARIQELQRENERLKEELAANRRSVAEAVPDFMIAKHIAINKDALEDDLRETDLDFDDSELPTRLERLDAEARRPPRGRRAVARRPPPRGAARPPRGAGGARAGGRPAPGAPPPAPPPPPRAPPARTCRRAAPPRAPPRARRPAAGSRWAAATSRGGPWTAASTAPWPTPVAASC